ncbi:MAG: serine hydrolase, partial [Coprococcus sp.]
MGRIRKRMIVWLLLGTFLLNTGFAAATVTVQAAPEVSTPSYIVMEASTGQVICEQDADTKRSPASITKIMTLLIVFEHIKSGRIHLEDQITTSAYAKSMGG